MYLKVLAMILLFLLVDWSFSFEINELQFI